MKIKLALFTLNGSLLFKNNQISEAMRCLNSMGKRINNARNMIDLRRLMSQK